MTIRKLTCLLAVLLAAACHGKDSPGDSTGGTGDVAVPGNDGTPDGGTPDGGGPDGGGPGDAQVPPGWNFGGNECGGAPDGDAVDEAFLVKIRLLGVENPGYEFLKLDAHLVVTVDDDPEPVVESDVVVDLAKSEAWLLGDGLVPADAKTVHVKISFDDYGAFEADGIAGALDARGLPIEFSAPADTFRFACHAVVSLFLECSVVGAGEDRVLLPQLVVRYW